MEDRLIKCFCGEHKDTKAIIFCQECRVYMCNKCESYHSKLFKNHYIYNLDKNIDDIFTGFCKEKNHLETLEYFCRTHNILCCGLCITKIKGKGKGEHKDCDVCFIEDIFNEKKNKLDENIKNLENLSKNLEESLNKIKITIEKINKSKEDLKLEVQKIFTKIRNTLNEREDQILMEINKKYEGNFLKEDIIKEFEKLPDKIKISLEKGNIIKKDWNDNETKLNSFINDCLIIENNIKNIIIINESMKKSNDLIDLNIKFYPNEDKDINIFLDKIKKFGDINGINSKIIDFHDLELIYNWIPNNFNNYLSLLYRMSDDGDSFLSFHNKCDNQFPALFIAKTKNGYKFGGYTSIGWNSKSNTYLSDKKSFLFSLNKEKKYQLQNNNNDTIGCYSNRGVDFHNDCYFYQDNSMKKCYSSGNHNYLKGIGKVLADNNETTFIVEEVEVYKIIPK